MRKFQALELVELVRLEQCFVGLCIFLLLAIVAGALGFFALAGVAAMLAKICLIVFDSSSAGQPVLGRLSKAAARLAGRRPEDFLGCDNHRSGHARKTSSVSTT